MNNPQFYIFGVPDGFDMYNATPERLNLFQLLYDSDCRDRRKMAIYRNVDNTEVSYIYLRYNMQSVKGRPNSFLGMALTFTEGYYCNNIPKLLNLFEEIYSALSKDVILTTRIIPSAGQARYRIGRFAEGTAAIIKIEEFVEAQTSNWFGDCVVPMDDTFRLNTQSVSLKQGLYLNTKSEHIIANLKTASWVYLSEPVSRPIATEPTPKPQPTPIPTPTPTSTPTPHTTPEPTPQPSPIVDPNIVAEQERQQKLLKDIVIDFNDLHDFNLSKQSKDSLTERRQKLYNLQLRLNGLQYAISTHEGNRLLTMIGEDINRIDNWLHGKTQEKKRWFAIAGVILILTLLIVFWPKHKVPSIDFDKTSIIEFVESSEKQCSAITDTLQSVTNDSLRNSLYYKSTDRLLNETRDSLKELDNLLSNDDMDSVRINSLQKHTAEKMESLNGLFQDFLKEKKVAEAKAKSEAEAKAKSEAEAKAKSEAEAKAKSEEESKKYYWWIIKNGQRVENPTIIHNGNQEVEIFVNNGVYWNYKDMVAHSYPIGSFNSTTSGRPPTLHNSRKFRGSGKVELFSDNQGQNKIATITLQ